MYIKLIISKGDSEKIIYVLTSLYTNFTASLARQEGKIFFEKLLTLLNRKAKLAGADYYLITALRLNPNEVNLKLARLNTLEAGVRPVAALVTNVHQVELIPENISWEPVSYDPYQFHLRCTKQREQEIAASKRRLSLAKLRAYARTIGRRILNEKKVALKQEIREQLSKQDLKPEPPQVKVDERTKLFKEAADLKNKILLLAGKVRVEAKRNENQVELPMFHAQAVALFRAEFNDGLQAVIAEEAQIENAGPSLMKKAAKIDLTYNQRLLGMDFSLKAAWQVRFHAFLAQVGEDEKSEYAKTIQDLHAEYQFRCKQALPYDDRELALVFKVSVAHYNSEYPNRELDDAAQKNLFNKLTDYLRSHDKRINAFNFQKRKKFTELFNRLYHPYVEARTKYIKEQFDAKLENQARLFNERSVDEWLKRLKNKGGNQILAQMNTYQSLIRQRYLKLIALYDAALKLKKAYSALVASIEKAEIKIRKSNLNGDPESEQTKMKIYGLAQDERDYELIGEARKNRLKWALRVFACQLKPNDDWIGLLLSDKNMDDMFEKVLLNYRNLTSFIPTILGFLNKAHKTQLMLGETEGRLRDRELKKEMLSLREQVDVHIKNIADELKYWNQLTTVKQAIATVSALDALVVLKIDEADLDALRMRIEDTQSRPMTLQQLKLLSKQDLNLLTNQLILLENYIKVLQAVPFWHKQVSGLKNVKASYMYPGEDKAVKLGVPDGAGAMMNAIINDKTLTIAAKLEKIKQTGRPRLEIKGVFNKEKPLTRRQVTHHFYKLTQLIDISDPDKLLSANQELEAFERKNLDKPDNQARERKMRWRFFSKPAVKIEPREQAEAANRMIVAA